MIYLNNNLLFDCNKYNFVIGLIKHKNDKNIIYQTKGAVPLKIRLNANECGDIYHKFSAFTLSN